ncbi:MAG TPA: carotenoid 1,2-hydratase [Rubrivivax sp.]|nr:carotenoid 1,2-hydratase [Rubrivivax sp.]
MNPWRRRWLLALASLGAGGAAQPAQPADDAAVGTVRRGRRLEFPRDHGAHLAARTEWWYATGWVGRGEQPSHGFQVTFFRSRTALAADNPSRFAARQLLFAHAALTDLGARRHHHDQRIARWSGAPQAALGAASQDDAAVRLGPWWLRREGERWRSVVAAAGFGLELTMERTQALLLQGDAGFSRKGPEERQASHYYSEPQLAASATLAVDGRSAGAPAAGRAWIDHEWSDEILHPDAVGWDWTGINLFDGSALTAFVLRRRDGSTLWAGGSFRAAGLPARIFAASELGFEAGRRWRSPQTGASYPVQWQLQTPAGRWELRSLMDEHELDSRGSTGTVYWEGLSELLDTAGRRVGLGYLEMTGYAGALRL